MGGATYCRLCGSGLTEGTRFCTECGAAVALETHSGTAPSTGPDGSLVWRVEVPLLTNRFIVTDTLLGVGATVLFSGTVFALIFGWNGGLRGVKAGLSFAIIAGLVILCFSVVTLGLIFGNRWPLEFVLDEHGVVQRNVSQRARAIHRLSWILALVTGRPLMAGPGLIAQSREVVGVSWRDVRRVHGYPKLGVVTIRGGVLDSVRLFCTPSNYAEVVQRIEAEVRAHAPLAVIT